MFIDSYHTVFTFRSLFYLLDVVLAFLISILKNFKSLQNYWHRVTDITSFGKRLESSLGHTLNFCPNLVQYRFKNMYLKESLTRSSTVILSTNQGGSKAKRISSRRARKWSNAFVVVSMTMRSSVWLKVLCLPLLQPCTYHSLSVALWLTRRLGLYDGPCLNLLRGDRILIPVPSDS